MNLTYATLENVFAYGLLVGLYIIYPLSIPVLFVYTAWKKAKGQLNNTQAFGIILFWPMLLLFKLFDKTFDLGTKGISGLHNLIGRKLTAPKPDPSEGSYRLPPKACRHCDGSGFQPGQK